MSHPLEHHELVLHELTLRARISEHLLAKVCRDRLTEEQVDAAIGKLVFDGRAEVVRIHNRWGRILRPTTA